MAYTVTSEMPLNMPTPGTREPAAISLLNANCIVISPHDHTTGKGVGVGRMRSGLQANRPAFGSAGNVYFATDTGRFYADTGTAWVGFITEGGQATVTGWTLIDPVIRDTLQFGPEGSGTIDNNITRTGANALRTDSNLGVGVAPAAWASAMRAVQVGRAGSIWANQDSGETIRVSSNTYFDGGQKALVAAAASQFDLGLGGFNVYTAPSVATGAAQTFTTRLSVAQDGLTTISSGDASPPLVLNRSNAAGDIVLQSLQRAGTAQWSFGLDNNQTFLLLTGAGVKRPLQVAQTGTVTLTPDAGQSGLVITGTAAGAAIDFNGGIQLIRNNTGTLLFHGAGMTGPAVDNNNNLGGASNRWAAVYSVNGTIQTSSLDMKENVHDLDPDLALEAVLNTPVFLFNYKSPPPPDPLPEDYQTPPQFEHAGYDAATADPLLVMDDQSVNAQNTSSVVIAALQALSAKVDELRSRLEATSGQAPAA